MSHNLFCFLIVLISKFANVSNDLATPVLIALIKSQLELAVKHRGR